MPNDQAQQPGGLAERDVVESRDGRPVCCSDLISGDLLMSANDKEPAWLGPDYYENRNSFPPEELAKYAGKYIAFSLDGTRILASGDTLEEMEKYLIAAGIDPSRVVGSYVDTPDVTGWIG